MAIPTAYTELMLAEYMPASLGGLGTALALERESFIEAVNDVLAAYGVSDVAQATDTAKLRALARVEALRVAQRAAAAAYDFSADGASFSRSQMGQRIEALLAAAEADVERVLAGGAAATWAVGVGTLAVPGDPYRFGYEVADDDEAEGVG